MAAEPAGTSFMTNRAPFSIKKPVCRVPFTAKLNSVARGCVCGVFMPQGPRKPIVMAMPLPITAGKLADDAMTVCPAAPSVSPTGGWRKSNTNYDAPIRLMEA